MTSRDLLTLTQWLSPAFPLGAFAYSHGLEAEIAEERIASAEQLEVWLTDVLMFGAGRTDAILLVQAMTGARPVAGLAALAEALASSQERYQETMEQGAAFARTVTALRGSDLAAAPLPVAVGAAAADLALAPDQVAALYLHAFVSNLVSVAVRIVPLGQTEGQAVLGRLHAIVEAVAADAAEAGLDDLGTASFGADMAAMRHETQGVRLFKT